MDSLECFVFPNLCFSRGRTCSSRMAGSCRSVPEASNRRRCRLRSRMTHVLCFMRANTSVCGLLYGLRGRTKGQGTIPLISTPVLQKSRDEGWRKKEDASTGEVTSIDPLCFKKKNGHQTNISPLREWKNSIPGTFENVTKLKCAIRNQGEQREMKKNTRW